MRSLSWCSALAAAVLAAGCGSGGGPYADTHGALRTGTTVVATSARARIDRVTYVGFAGPRVDGFIASALQAGRHPAVLFLHGSGGSATDFLVWAAALAQAGGVGMTIQEPNDASDYTPLVVNARRALDVLDARPDVDPTRIGVLGFSLGAQTAAILAGVDRRVRVVGLMSGRGTGEVLKYVRRAHARFFVEAGRHDEVVPQAQLEALIAAVPQPKRVRWFDARHALTSPAVREQAKWLQTALGLRG